MGILSKIFNKPEQAPSSTKTIIIGDSSIIKNKGITEEMVFNLETKLTQQYMQNKIYFPKTLGNLSFTRRLCDYMICVITTQRPDYSKITLSQNLLLLPEPTNKYDKNAIVVLSSTQKLGYVYKNGLQDMLNEKFREGCVIVGPVIEVDAKKDWIKMDIALYK